MARVFVTGANGFIAPHLIRLLLERGNHVTGLVRATSDTRGLAPLFPEYGERLRLVLGDLRQPESFAAVLEEMEYVYHLGAVLSGTTKEEFLETNVTGTERLLEAVMSRRNESFQRFLFTSSLAAAGPTPDGQPIDENAPLNPISWYGESKRDAEAVVHRFGEAGLPVTITRPAGVYGENERLLADGTFPTVQMGLKPKVSFSKKMVSMVYVGDLVEGIVAAAESPAAKGRVYFLSDPEPYSEGDLMTAVADGLGTRIRIPVLVPIFVLRLAAVIGEWMHCLTRNLPMVTRDKVREVSAGIYACSTEAAKRDLGWESQVSLAEGMKQTARYWVNRRKANNAVNQPLRDRIRQTVTITFVLGLIESTLDTCAGGMTWDGFARALGLAGGVPVGGVYALVTILVVLFIGSASMLTQRKGFALRFLAGAVVGIGLELANQLWLGFWDWNPETFGRLASPWVISLVLGIGAGLGPVITNGIIQSIHNKRLRTG